jgi:hypothetical protein
MGGGLREEEHADSPSDHFGSRRETLLNCRLNGTLQGGRLPRSANALLQCRFTATSVPFRAGSTARALPQLLPEQRAISAATVAVRTVFSGASACRRCEPLRGERTYVGATRPSGRANGRSVIIVRTCPSQRRGFSSVLTCKISFSHVSM